MRKLMARAEHIARLEQQRVSTRIADALTHLLPAAEVVTDGQQVAVRGRGLARRWLIDPSLRLITAVAR